MMVPTICVSAQNKLVPDCLRRPWQLKNFVQDPGIAEAPQGDTAIQHLTYTPRFFVNPDFGYERRPPLAQ
jgi:hypothetical protein